MKTFLHSGKLGDCLFSLPTIKAMGGGVLYIPQKGPEVETMFSDMFSLLKSQSYITNVIRCPDVLTYEEEPVKVDVNLNKHRQQTMKGVIHIVKRHMDACNVRVKNWQEPWLELNTIPSAEPYTLFNYTGRNVYNSHWDVNSKVNWQQVYAGVPGLKYFVGHPAEYGWFCKMVWAKPEYLPTKTVYELSVLVKNAAAVYCNQSLVLALSQSLGKDYWLDVKPGKTNCLIYSQNEHLL